MPRHPAMLDEAGAYFIVFCVVYVAHWKTSIARFPGRILVVTPAVAFLARFVMEFVKEEQAALERDALEYGTAAEHSSYHRRPPAHLLLIENAALTSFDCSAGLAAAIPVAAIRAIRNAQTCMKQG